MFTREGINCKFTLENAVPILASTCPLPILCGAFSVAVAFPAEIGRVVVILIVSLNTAPAVPE
ncbi:MAG: hypothetical protein DDT19_01166 [Syntrophomonadaceae bacterium]|nr:hypothetical protein [Bacillota bacterium]